MSSDNLNPNPPWDDQRITAYVMNELTGEDKASFETEMNENETLANAVAEAREVTAKLSGFYASIPEEQLDANRLAVLSGESEPVMKHTTSSFRLVKLFVVAASIVFVLAFLAYPAFKDSRQTARLDGRLSETAALLVEEEHAPPRDVAAPFESSPRPARAEMVKQTEVAPASELTPATIDAIRSRNVEYGKARDEQTSVKLQANTDIDIARRAMAMSESKREARQYFREDSPTPFAAPMPMGEAKSPQPSAPGSNVVLSKESSEALAGGFALPTDAIKSQARGAQSRGRAAGEVVEDLLDMLESDDLDQDLGMGGDKYDRIVENTFKRVAKHPYSTLSIDVDTASYSKVRMSLRGNRLPQPDAVRIEEMLNYFEYDYSQKVPGTVSDETKRSDPFVAGMAVADCPWTPGNRLVRVGLQAIELEKKERPQCNLVFLIDTSGSMRASNKLPLVIDGMKLLLKELRPDDRVAIVVYAGSAGLVLDSTPAKKKKKIINALSKLQSGGSTNGGAGLRLAYETARENFSKKGVNRVILCSDGDFNVGMTGTDELVREAKSQAKSGVDLTVLGFGMGNHNDAMMERISNDAEGNYGFIDSIAEAKKVLVDQLTGTLVTVAKDVKIQIKFNPALVSSYRLIGYENRVLAKKDFDDDKKDAGEIGAGHRVTALYEVVPKGKLPAAITPADNPSVLQPNDNADPEEETELDTFSETQLLSLRLRYKPPQGEKSTLMTRALLDEGQSFDDADADFRFAAAVAGFGMQLRNSEYAGQWTYDDVIEVARSAKGSDPHGLRAEMVELAEKARSLTIND